MNMFCDSFSQQKPERGAQFWFATGGAGFCISRPVVKKMTPLIENGNLVKISDRIRFPDDVTVGFILGEQNEQIQIEMCIKISLKINYSILFQSIC